MQQSEPDERRQRRRNHLKLLNYTMTVDDDRVEATVHTSGLAYSDYDGISGHPKPFQLMKLLESARYFAHHWPLDDTGRTFRDYAEMTSDRMTFLVTSKMDICKSLYDPLIPKSPVDVKIKGGHIGNTSVSSIATAFTKDGTQLLSNINQVVSVDRETRRPIPIPDWWKTRYVKSSENYSSLRVSRLEKKEGIEAFQIRVLRSDLDGYRHVNWSSYVRFSLDAIHHSIKNQMITSLGDTDKTGLKSMELLYAGECFDGDTVDIFVWGPEDTLNVACVQIYKKSDFIFQGSFEYF